MTGFFQMIRSSHAQDVVIGSIYPQMYTNGACEPIHTSDEEVSRVVKKNLSRASDVSTLCRTRDHRREVSKGMSPQELLETGLCSGGRRGRTLVILLGGVHLDPGIVARGILALNTFCGTGPTTGPRRLFSGLQCGPPRDGSASSGEGRRLSQSKGGRALHLHPRGDLA